MQALPTLLTVALLAPLASGEPLDRIAVSVGRDVIAESALVLYLRVTAFLDHKPLVVTGAAKREAAERLVDRALMLHEAADSHFALPTDADAEVLVDQVKAQYASEDEFSADLDRHEITEHDLLEHLRAGLEALRFTDLRFRPAITVNDEDVRAYYDKMAAVATGQPASFEESRDQIENLIVGQRVLDALDEWLKTARTNTSIQYREKVFQ